MIFGRDLSKYQNTDAVQPEFVILNVEDPYLASKARRAVDLGIVWDVYKWCFPGQDGGAMFRRAQALVAALGLPGRQPGYWLDYEEAGVAPNQVTQWFAATDAAGVQAGWYCYLYLLNAQGNVAPGRPLWLAYYPGSNDGSYYPSMSDTARNKGARLHQYTSTAGTLDQNIVLDEKWWSMWSDTVTPGPPPATEVTPDMNALCGPLYGVTGADDGTGNVVLLMQGSNRVHTFRGPARTVYGVNIPASWLDWPHTEGIDFAWVGDDKLGGDIMWNAAYNTQTGSPV